MRTEVSSFICFDSAHLTYLETICVPVHTNVTQIFIVTSGQSQCPRPVDQAPLHLHQVRRPPRPGLHVLSLPGFLREDLCHEALEGRVQNPVSHNPDLWLVIGKPVTILISHWSLGSQSQSWPRIGHKPSYYWLIMTLVMLTVLSGLVTMILHLASLIQYSNPFLVFLLFLCSSFALLSFW